MKKFIKENWFKLFILLFLSSLLININNLISSYIFYLNESENRLEKSEIFNRQVKCDELEIKKKEFFNNIDSVYYNPLYESCNTILKK